MKRQFVASILSIPCEERYGTRTMTPQRHKDEALRTPVDISGGSERSSLRTGRWADPTTLGAGP
jgi:hypothetical protein